MTTGDTLFGFTPLHSLALDWLWVAFTSGSTEPSLGDTIYGATSSAEATLEYISVESGTWGGGDAAGYMLLSKWNKSAWSSGENFNNTDDASDHGTLTGTPVVCAATIDRRNNKPCLDFDDTVNEIVMFQGIMPRHYDGGGMTVTVGVMATSATTNDMSWKIFFMSVSDDVDDLDVKNFAAPQANQAVDAPSVSGEVKYFTIGFTDGAQMDSIGVGEIFFMLLMRDAQDGTNDTMVGDAEFVSAESQEA